MKRAFLLSYFLLTIFGISFSQNVGIGTVTPNSSARLDITSTNSGLLPPRMTTAQRNAIPNPSPGLIIFNTTTESLELFTRGWSVVNFSSPAVKKLYGGTNQDQGSSIDQTNDGGYIIVGFSSSSNTGTLTGINSNGGTYDAWVQKLDMNGSLQWQKLLGGTGVEFFTTVHQTSDGGYIIAGYSTSSNTGTLAGIINNGGTDFWIVKLDAAGNTQWQKLLGGNADEYALNIQPTSDGGYIVVGSSFSTNTGTLAGFFNYGNSDDWIVKLNGSGTIQWQRLWGGSLADQATAVQQATDGGYIITGISMSSNSGVLTGLTTNGAEDNWILKLDNNGNLQWQKLLGGNATDFGVSCHQSPDGGYIIGGQSYSSNTGTLAGVINNGSSDYWIVKLNATGNLVWQRLFGGTQFETFNDLKITTDGGCIIAGDAQSSNTGTLTGYTSNGNYDEWILKLDASGNIQWQKLVGGNMSEAALCVCQTTDGGYVIAGSSNSSNTGILAGYINNGDVDCFILKLDKYGNPF